MNIPAYDILKDDGVSGNAWIEAVSNLEAAKDRARKLAAKAPGEYIIFSQETGQVVARVRGEAKPS